MRINAKNCKICNYAFQNMNNFGVDFYNNDYFCSDECRKKWEAPVHLAFGVFVVVIGIPLNLLSFPLSIFLLTIGFLWFLKGLRDYNLPTYSTDVRTILDEKLTPNDNKIKTHVTYSDILGKKVLNCCHQTARIGDLYCICGRALHYPNILRSPKM